MRNEKEHWKLNMTKKKKKRKLLNGRGLKMILIRKSSMVIWDNQELRGRRMQSRYQGGRHGVTIAMTHIHQHPNGEGEGGAG